MFKRTATVVVTFWVGLAGCTVGQTGEEQTFPECDERPTSVDPGDSTAIGIEPEAYFQELQSQPLTLTPEPAGDAAQGGAIEVAFTQLLGAEFVDTQPAGIAADSDCPDFVSLQVELTLQSVDSQLFEETLSATVRVFEDGSARVTASLPKDEIQGEFGADGLTPTGSSFERLGLEIELRDGEVHSLRLSAESDAEDRTPEPIVSWP